MSNFSSELSDRLKMLGVRLGTKDLPEPVIKSSHLMETIFPGGEYLTTPQGEIFSVTKSFDLKYFHGSHDLNPPVHIEPLSRWLGITSQNELFNAADCLFLDAETSGLSGGTGTFPFMIGLGFYTQNEFFAQQLFITDPVDEPGMLDLLEKITAKFNTLVTFNGKAFDIPLLRTRCLLHHFPDFFNKHDQIDLLRVARRIWNKRLSSKSLSSLEKEILGFQRSQEEVPGWLVPEIYFEYLRDGDARILEGVFYHNQMDIVSMAALLSWIGNFLNAPLESEEIPGMDLAETAKIFHEIGDLDTAINLYRKSIRTEMPEPFLIQTIDKFARLYRSHHKLTEAIELWQLAAECGQISACIELAKIYEHSIRDIPNALSWTEIAISVITKKQFLPPFLSGNEILELLEHRRQRLLRKLLKENA